MLEASCHLPCRHAPTPVSFFPLYTIPNNPRVRCLLLPLLLFLPLPHQEEFGVRNLRLARPEVLMEALGELIWCLVGIPQTCSLDGGSRINRAEEGGCHATGPCRGPRAQGRWGWQRARLGKQQRGLTAANIAMQWCGSEPFLTPHPRPLLDPPGAGQGHAGHWEQPQSALPPHHRQHVSAASATRQVAVHPTHLNPPPQILSWAADGAARGVSAAHGPRSGRCFFPTSSVKKRFTSNHSHGHGSSWVVSQHVAITGQIRSSGGAPCPLRRHRSRRCRAACCRWSTRRTPCGR